MFPDLERNDGSASVLLVIQCRVSSFTHFCAGSRNTMGRYKSNKLFGQRGYEIEAFKGFDMTNALFLFTVEEIASPLAKLSCEN